MRPLRYRSRYLVSQCYRSALGTTFSPNAQTGLNLLTRAATIRTAVISPAAMVAGEGVRGGGTR